MKNKVIQLEIANALVIKLWLQGLLKDCEKDRLLEKNKKMVFS